jgi:hypothetical protein
MEQPEENSQIKYSHYFVVLRSVRQKLWDVAPSVPQVQVQEQRKQDKPKRADRRLCAH